MEGVERPKISVYSITDLKNTTDDTLPNYLNSLQFHQSHVYTDTRLLLSFAAVAIAGATFYLDYTLGWDATKAGTFWAVIVYFLLNGALTLWIWAVEKGRVYVGELNGVELHIQSRVEKHNPMYFVSARYCTSIKATKTTTAAAAEQQQKWRTVDIQAPFSRWFDEQGHLVVQHLQQWLATEIPVVGGADPKNVIPQASGVEKVRRGDPSLLQTAFEGAETGTDTQMGGPRLREKKVVGGGGKGRAGR
ncbi:MAG: hypothetical protein M1816_006878 [Peltula sp. TS41687]|nr:MAG: hypothetical protein M1816_006878 [Peltula sp. TS41687]